MREVSPAQGRVRFAALTTSGMVQGMLVAVREFAISPPTGLHIVWVFLLYQPLEEYQ